MIFKAFTVKTFPFLHCSFLIYSSSQLSLFLPSLFFLCFYFFFYYTFYLLHFFSFIFLYILFLTTFLLWQLLIKIINSTLSSLIEQEFYGDHKRTQQEVSNILLSYLYYKCIVYAVIGHFGHEQFLFSFSFIF